MQYCLNQITSPIFLIAYATLDGSLLLPMEGQTESQL